MTGADRHGAVDAHQRAELISSRMAPRASPFYSNVEAAAFLHLSPRTLEKMRVIGGGPPFRKFGRRVFYTLPDLEEWAGRRKCDSTSDPASKRQPPR
jgi:hypothetical protein